MPRSAPLIKITNKLTRKQKAFSDELLDDPKISGTEAAMQTYGKQGKQMAYQTAASIASENLKKPEIQLYLSQHDYRSQETIAEMMQQRDDKRLAFDAARDIQDRLHGKATQRIEQHTTTVSLGLSLKDITPSN